MENLLLQTDSRGVARLTLNRPQVHNAFDDALIGELLDRLDELENDSDVRVVVLAANGRNFCAGADLNWMRRCAAFSFEENLADARRLAELMRSLNCLSKPTLALVQGVAYGGGVGLCAACDIVIATGQARFCLSEVKLGLIASVISPYVRAAIGESQTRRYTLSAEVFDADEARRIGLVHEVTPDDGLEERAGRMIDQLLNNGPAAMAEVKDQAFRLPGGGISGDVIEETAQRIARVRASAEGREGILAFLEKRPPSWARGR